MTELNGCPEWFDAFAGIQSAATQAVLTAEIEAELREVATLNHPHTLNALRYGLDNARRLVGATLRSSLIQWPKPPKDADREACYSQNLDTVLSILVMAGEADISVAELCETRFLAQPKRSSSTVWLQGLCACDLARGVDALEQGLKAIPKSKQPAYAVRWFSGLFGTRDRFRVPVALDGDATLLARLAKLSRKWVRPEDDIEHEGVYSPGERDEAQNARGQLFGVLAERPGLDAHQALTSLARDALFADISDRIIVLARERAAKDSEAASFSPEEFRNWERTFEAPPKTRDDLFRVMLDRLDDIDHDIRHHDFSDRATLAAIDQETEI